MMGQIELRERTFIFAGGSVVVHADGDGWRWTVICGDERVASADCYVNLMAARANGMLRLQAMVREASDG